METMTSQMHEAERQLKGLLKVGLVVMLLLVGLLLVNASLAFGALLGAAFAAANLVLLFYCFAPYFFSGERPAFVLVGALISLGVGAGLMWSAVFFDLSYAVGLAIGVAMPAATGMSLLKAQHPA